MLERTKKLPIETVVLCYRGPAAKRREADDFLSAIGFSPVEEDAVPWREAMPDIADATLPGVCLRGARHREGLTQMELAQRTGIPQRHISEMENGKRPIGAKNARILGETLGVGYKVFL